MKTVHINASQAYDVLIGPGLLQELGSRTAQVLKGRHVMLVSDDTVFGLYGEKAVKSLENAGFQAETFVFPHGERSKNGETFFALVNAMADSRLTRTDGVIALGGGVTGDLAGFAAACYLRGVPCVQVPTSLLAMVDSSVGGKTAIDLPAGKNLCGAFHQPCLVVCDTDLLKTLPEDVFRDGCAEVIKYAVLGEKGLFCLLKNEKVDWETVVASCVRSKAGFVEADEFDNGARQFLNLGHTLGHAVEANSKFSLSHGKAVAVGMAMVANSACQKGLLPPKDRDEILGLLKAYGLPVETEQSAESICQTALGDKKRRGSTITLVIPTAKDRCILHPISVEDLPQWVEKASP